MGVGVAGFVPFGRDLNGAKLSGVPGKTSVLCRVDYASFLSFATLDTPRGNRAFGRLLECRV